MGYELVPWQEQLAHDIGAVDASGKWVHPRVGISIPRQQGKSVDLIVWVAVMAALAGYKVLWTEHNYSTTMEMVDRFRKIFGRRPGDTSEGIPRWRKLLVEVCSQTGQEWMRFSSGGVIQFSTRTKSSRLGFSFDIVIYDEAQELTGIHTQVINPTTTGTPPRCSRTSGSRLGRAARRRPTCCGWSSASRKSATSGTRAAGRRSCLRSDTTPTFAPSAPE